MLDIIIIIIIINIFFLSFWACVFLPTFVFFPYTAHFFSITHETGSTADFLFIVFRYFPLGLLLSSSHSVFSLYRPYRPSLYNTHEIDSTADFSATFFTSFLCFQNRSLVVIFYHLLVIYCIRKAPF